MADRFDSFSVPLGVHLLSRFVHRNPGFWKWLGRLEAKSLREKLDAVSIETPIYVTGLARSGSTILLEALAAHPRTATHQYRDFPGVLTPVWWGRGQRDDVDETPRERAHGDGLAVTTRSPEAMEEMVWMAFFRDAHDPSVSNVLDKSTSRPDFEAFYGDHLRKVLLLRGATRYLAKGNYNVARLPYLLKLFPDARFVVPLRRPAEHIASLMKQHRLFCEAETAHPRALAHMQRVGHYEFGLDRRPICLGDPAATRQVVELWENGEEVRGWARYWAQLHGWLADRLEESPSLERAVHLVRYDDLCDDPSGTLRSVFRHCDLAAHPSTTSFADRIHRPTYYRPDLSPVDLAVIAEETRDVAEQLDLPVLPRGVDPPVAAAREPQSV